MQAERKTLLAKSIGLTLLAHRTKKVTRKRDFDWSKIGALAVFNHLHVSVHNKGDACFSSMAKQAAVPMSTGEQGNAEITSYVERESAILDFVKGRKVLHLGCVGFTDLDPNERVAMASHSLHWTLSQIADVVGIDSAEKVVREYERLGIFRNILVGDVTRIEELRLSAKFDVILAGDILEHVSNPGSMLDGLRGLCHSETKLVLTTPNAFGLPNFLRFIAGRFVEGEEHVMTFNMQNLQHLLTRHGFKIEKAQTCYQGQARSLKLLFRIGSAFLRRFPKFGGTLLAVAVPTGKAEVTEKPTMNAKSLGTSSLPIAG